MQARRTKASHELAGCVKRLILQGKVVFVCQYVCNQARLRRSSLLLLSLRYAPTQETHEIQRRRFFSYFFSSLGGVVVGDVWNFGCWTGSAFSSNFGSSSFSPHLSDSISLFSLRFLYPSLPPLLALLFRWLERTRSSSVPFIRFQTYLSGTTIKYEAHTHSGACTVEEE